MSVETRWYDVNKKIMLFTVGDPWSIAEIIDSMRATEEQYQIVGEPIHFIVDMRATRGVPQGLLSTGIDLNAHLLFPKISITVIVGASRSLQLFARLLVQLGLRVNTVFVDEIEEAIPAIRKLSKAQLNHPKPA